MVSMVLKVHNLEPPTVIICLNETCYVHLVKHNDSDMINERSYLTRIIKGVIARGNRNIKLVMNCIVKILVVLMKDG